MNALRLRPEAGKNNLEWAHLWNHMPICYLPFALRFLADLHGPMVPGAAYRGW